MASAILPESAVFFLGLGIQRPTPTRRNMFAGSKGFVQTATWLVWWPGLMILITVLCVNVVGDGLRDGLDPADPTTGGHDDTAVASRPADVTCPPNPELTACSHRCVVTTPTRCVVTTPTTRPTMTRPTMRRTNECCVRFASARTSRISCSRTNEPANRRANH